MRPGKREPLSDADGVLVVSLFVTLIMESPLARGPPTRPTNGGCAAIVYYRFSPPATLLVQPNLARVLGTVYGAR